jgi:hypothetical protein
MSGHMPTCMPFGWGTLDIWYDDLDTKPVGWDGWLTMYVRQESSLLYNNYVMVNWLSTPCRGPNYDVLPTITGARGVCIPSDSRLAGGLEKHMQVNPRISRARPHSTQARFGSLTPMSKCPA